MKTVVQLYTILTSSERRRALFLMALIIIMALIDALGVASILPFIAILSNPDLVYSNNALNWLYQFSSMIGVETLDQFLFVFGALVLLMLVVALTVKALTTYAQTKFSMTLEYSISTRLLERFLDQPYSWFVQRNSADLSKSILSEVGAVIGYGFTPTTTLFAQSAIVVSITGLLILVNPLLSLIVGLIICVSYLVIFVTISGMLRRLGEGRTLANEERFKSVSEVFGAVKEVKFDGLEEIYIRRFSGSAKIYSLNQVIAQIIGQMPRYALEAIAFGGLMVLILFLMLQTGSFTSSVPTVTLYAFAGYRLMPAVQQIYWSLTQLRFVGPGLDSLCEHLSLPSGCERPSVGEPRLRLCRDLTLREVSFGYSALERKVLRNINLTIFANTKVAFVGTTGGGKTTLIDIILGLLEPSSGTMLVDSVPITALNCYQWRKSIGYVPQSIYLADGSIAENIAFGVPREDIDYAQVKKVAAISGLHSFVSQELPDEYTTIVGERGVRLSGGQRQRIGIARALYHNPSVLVLDEATSALDSVTEKTVMDEINQLGHDMTIIMVAHRLSTVKNCDKIFVMDHGKIVSSGSHDELIETCEIFARFVRGAAKIK